MPKPNTIILELEELRGLDTDYPIILLAEHSQYGAKDPYRKLYFQCGVRVGDDGLSKKLDGTMDYLGLKGINITTDDDDEPDHVVDAERKTVAALVRHFQEQFSGAGISGVVRSSYESCHGHGINYEIAPGQEPKRSRGNKSMVSLKIRLSLHRIMQLLMFEGDIGDFKKPKTNFEN